MAFGIGEDKGCHPRMASLGTNRGAHGMPSLDGIPLKLHEAWGLNHECKLSIFDWLRIRKEKRYKKGKVSIWGREWKYVDGTTLIVGLKEIFVEKIYQFETENETPLIIDCGSNIGFSVYYFKQLFPKAKVIAFEADPVIFDVLGENMANTGLKDIELINKAVWDKDETLEFRSEGGMSGRVRIKDEEGELYKVQGTRLKDYLNRKVDFLKIDIEGAEYRVISDCREELKNVERIFVEYHSPKNEEQKLSEILEILKTSGFRVYVKEAYVPKNPFMDIQAVDGMDLQLNLYGVRQ